MTLHEANPHAQPAWPARVGILGAAGLIGSGVAAGLAMSGACRELYLVDRRTDLLRAHAIDIAEAQVVAGTATTALISCQADEAPEVDVVVVAASAPETPDGDRRHLLDANVEVLRSLAPAIRRMAGAGGVVLLLSNPVDVLADALRRLSEIEPRRIIGYSLNDSVRFRMAAARELGVHPQRVEGWVLGEHGSGQVPVFSRLRVDGTPVDLDADARDRVRAETDGWFARWSALRPGRSSGWTTPAGALTTIAALASGQVHPASVWTGGELGLPHTFVTLPARLSREGLAGVEDWSLTVEEHGLLLRAAQSVQALAAAVVTEKTATAV